MGWKTNHSSYVLIQGYRKDIWLSPPLARICIEKAEERDNSWEHHDAGGLIKNAKILRVSPPHTSWFKLLAFGHGVSCSCSHEASPAWQLKTREMNSVRVLEARSKISITDLQWRREGPRSLWRLQERTRHLHHSDSGGCRHVSASGHISRLPALSHGFLLFHVSHHCASLLL